MQLGVSGLMGSPGDGASGGSSEAGAASSSVPGGGTELETVGGGGGNRWPRQETVALLKIRSDMEAAFRESSLKGPLWEEISRKMAELGYQRSSKKCKEKFENVYKYHKRTKDGRATKSDGKTYRFFEQLEAFEATTAPPPPPMLMLPSSTAPSLPTILASPNVTVSSTGSPNPVSVAAPPAHAIVQPSNSSFQPPPRSAAEANASNPPQIHQAFQPHFPGGLLSNSTSTSSTSSDEDVQRRRGRKRKWKDFFQKLMKDVIHKQDELHSKFLDAFERRERDRMAREEGWRAQETARLNREHELLVHERNIAAAKDATVISFLQKVTEQPNLKIPSGNTNPPPPGPPENPSPPIVIPSRPPPPPPPKAIVAAPTATPTKMSSDSGGGGDNSPASSSRWPKAEVEALINLRTNLDLKYQDNGPKGPLWEEISSAMAKIGYNRSSKRCKEKWENINKYFKKVKESNKRRPEDSKTCPYFHQLDALYREKAIRNDAVSISFSPVAGNSNYGGSSKTDNIPNNMAPIMARPEQQWPLAPDHHQQQQQQPHDSAMPDHEDEDEDDYDDEDEDPEDEGGGFEIVEANKQPSSVTNPAELGGGGGGA